MLSCDVWVNGDQPKEMEVWVNDFYRVIYFVTLIDPVPIVLVLVVVL